MAGTLPFARRNAARDPKSPKFETVLHALFLLISETNVSNLIHHF